MVETVYIQENTAHDYFMEYDYANYLINKIDQENRLFISLMEASILNETNIRAKIEKQMIVNEAKLGDGINDKFHKFVEFMKNLFGKFMANISHVLLDEKKYLEKYSEIINGKKGKSEIEISYHGDHEKGINRITSVTVPLFDWNQHAAALNSESYGQFIKLIPGLRDFDYDETQDLASQFKEYFIGGEEGNQTKSLDELNFRNMYNFCYDFKKIENVTKKDISSLEKSTEKIRNYIQQEIKGQSTQQQNNQNTEEQKESTLILSNNYFNEAENKNGQQTGTQQSNGQQTGTQQSNGQQTGTQQSNGQQTGTQQSNGQQTGTQQSNAAGKSNLTTSVSKASGSVNSDDKNIDDNKVKNQAGDAAKNVTGTDNEKLTQVDKVINNYNTVCSAVIKAKWTGAEQIAKDYMKIIHTHVKSYIGKENDPGDKNYKQATKYGANNPNDNSNGANNPNDNSNGANNPNDNGNNPNNTKTATEIYREYVSNAKKGRIKYNNGTKVKSRAIPKPQKNESGSDYTNRVEQFFKDNGIKLQ